MGNINLFQYILLFISCILEAKNLLNLFVKQQLFGNFWCILNNLKFLIQKNMYHHFFRLLGAWVGNTNKGLELMCNDIEVLMR